MRCLRAWALAWLLAAALSALLIQGIPAQGGELLVNGGFEEGTDPWTPSGGELTTLDGAGRDGSTAGVFTAEEAPVHRVSQCVPAWEGGEYEFAAYLARPPASPVASVSLNTVWYDLDGCHGQEVGPPQDLGAVVLEEAGTWYELEVEPFSGEPGSRSARLNVFLDFLEDGEKVYLDDFSFRGPPAPPPTPTPTATLPPTSTPTPTATASPAPSPHPTPQPTGTAIPPRPTASPSPSSGGDEPSPPILFGLINGGFEEIDGEGRLLGWRKYGGELARSADARTEGRFSAAFSSRTESTKWVFQTMRVEGGRAYDLGGYALKNGPNVEAAYLRLSWYASADGSGQAISSGDSTERLTEDSPDFRFLTTGAVVAPAEASSAKVRLMLDPVSEAEAIVYFDAISFEETEMPPPNPEDPPAPTVVPGDEGPPSPTASPPTPSSPVPSSGWPTPVPPLSPSASPSSPPSSRTTPSATTADGDGSPTARAHQVSIDGRHLEVSPEHTPATLYRDRSTSASLLAPQSTAADSGGGAPWPAVLGLAGLAVALGLGGGLYLWQRRGKRARLP